MSGINPRRVALEALMDITERGAYANLRLKEIALEGEQAKWVAALIYETLDHLSYIDYILADIAKGRQKPVIRAILRLSACQMLYMRVPPSAACDEGVKLAKAMGKSALSGYVNGVLRELSRRLDDLPKLPDDIVERYCIQYGWPRFLIEEWIDRFGEKETAKLLEAKPQPMQIRAQWPFSAESLTAALEKRGIGYTIGEYDPECLRLCSGFDVVNDELFNSGRMTVQGESAMLACRACSVAPDMRVLDACASPGGKSAYLYSLAKGELELHAWEPAENRLELLKKTLERLNVKANIKKRDACEYDEAYKDSFDIVLIDAPCSALGSGKPDARYRRTREDILSLSVKQSRLLDTCSRYVKPGGALIYSTCTLSYDENEGQVERFLAEHKGFKLDAIPWDMPHKERGIIELLPHKHGLDGFFIARMVRDNQCT